VNIGQLVNKIPTNKLNKESDKLVDSKTLLGVEVEVENYAKAPDSTMELGYWTIKPDNSLRNNGMEFVFTEPLSGADAVRAATWLCSQAKTKDYKISNLCGIHVHMDVRDMDVEIFRTFIATYCITEPLIYNWVGDGRDTNMFCLPWFMADGDLQTISGLIKNPKPQSAKGVLNGLSKYSGLNLNSIPRFGTVEFRMLQTTFNEQRIIDWMNIILSLKKHAVAPGNTPEKVCGEIKALGAYATACKIFGYTLANRMWYPKYAKDAISLGLTTADWFLETAKDMFLKDKPKGSIFEWTSLNKLKGKDLTEEGEHTGLKLWTKSMEGKFATVKKDLKRPLKKSLEAYADLYTKPAPTASVSVQLFAQQQTALAQAQAQLTAIANGTPAPPQISGWDFLDDDLTTGP
jgi:hypothetical protein